MFPVFFQFPESPARQKWSRYAMNIKTETGYRKGKVQCCLNREHLFFKEICTPSVTNDQLHCLIGTENKKQKTIQVMKTKLLLIAGVLVCTFTSCIDEIFIRGNGIADSEARIVPAFTSVASEGPFEVHVSYGTDHEVVIHAESNLIPYIETDVRGGNLRLHVKGLHGLNNRLPIEVFVQVPHLEALVQSGSGFISTGWLSAESVNFVVSGSGSIESSVEADVIDGVVSGSGFLYLTGVAGESFLTVSGSGEIDAWDLLVRDCDVKVSGSGDVWVDVDRFLKAVISGSGHVYYSGTPHVESVVSGSGGVIHKN